MRRKSSVEYESSSSEALIISRVDPLRVELNLKQRRSLDDLGEDTDAENNRLKYNIDVNLVFYIIISKLLINNCLGCFIFCTFVINVFEYLFKQKRVY